MERVTDPETASEAWKAAILPLNYTRVLSGRNNRTRTYISRLSVSTGYKPAALPLSYIPIGGSKENRTPVQTFSLWLLMFVEPFLLPNDRPNSVWQELSSWSSPAFTGDQKSYTRPGGGSLNLRIRI